jgi:hypothetical protein
VPLASPSVKTNAMESPGQPDEQSMYIAIITFRDVVFQIIFPIAGLPASRIICLPCYDGADASAWIAGIA